MKNTMYKNKTLKLKVIFLYKNNLTKNAIKNIIIIGDKSVKERNIFKKNKRFL